jgi:hypothetical protein
MQIILAEKGAKKTHLPVVFVNVTKFGEPLRRRHSLPPGGG